MEPGGTTIFVIVIVVGRVTSTQSVASGRAGVFVGFVAIFAGFVAIVPATYSLLLINAFS